MVQLSTIRKATILGRIVAQRVGHTRVAGAVVNAARVTGAHVGRVLHVLWLEVTGFVFLGIALICAGAGVHEYAKYQAGQIGIGKTALAAAVTLMFAWFGVSSFWRVRRKRSSQSN
jgi:hypothetical protein